MSKAPEPSDWESLFSWGTKLAGVELPGPLAMVFGYLIIATVFVLIVLALATGIKQLITLLIPLTPKMYSAEARTRSRARRQFAEYIRFQIERMNRSENWRDDDFTELEAEVEASGRRIGRLAKLRGKSVFRARSLTKALEKSAERLVLVEGDPGAGKSVALRHVVHHVALAAANSYSAGTTLPVYINLKEIYRKPDEQIDDHLIKRFVIYTLKRNGDRFADEFIDNEFDVGLKSGKWLFLFDSFDEIPEVLSSTDSDRFIRAYSEAISDFLGGLNQCRGIVASREYRGPKSQGWTVFRVSPLSWRKQRDLISKFLINEPKLNVEVESGVLNASNDVKIMARNPMLLGLLCEHVRLRGSFPSTAFEVFSKYLEYRFERDAQRVSDRFTVDVDMLRQCATVAAFCMTADNELGLTPSVDEIIRSSLRFGFRINTSAFRRSLQALIYMRLARSVDDETGPSHFTFSHRRFQEYLATQIVIAKPELVSANDLLTNGRWRETAVVILQTSSGHGQGEIYEEAYRVLHAGQGELTISGGKDATLPAFPWSAKELHILGIIQAGRSDENGAMPEHLRQLIDKRLTAASGSKNLLDTKLALDVAGAASVPVLIELMKQALETRSRWINDVVYRQASRLAHPEDAVYDAIRQYIIRLFIDKRINGEYQSTRAFLARLPEPRQLVDALHLARVTATFDRWGFAILAALCICFDFGDQKSIVAALMINTVAQISKADGLLHRTGVLHMRLFAIVFMLASLIEQPKPLVLDRNIIHISTVLLSVYCIIIAISAVQCIRSKIMSKALYLPVLPFGAAYVIASKLAHEPRRLKALVTATFLAIIAGALVYYITHSWEWGRTVLNICAGIGVCVFGVACIVLVVVTFVEFRKYRAWSRNPSRFSPDVFYESFRKTNVSLLHVLMLERLSIEEGESDKWLEKIVNLISAYDADLTPKMALIDSRHYKLTTYLHPSYDNKDRLIDKFVREVSFIRFAMLDRDYIDRRRDLLFQKLEAIRKLSDNDGV